MFQDLPQRRVHVESLIDELHTIRVGGIGDSSAALDVLKATTAITSLLVGGGIGECRKATPFSALQPVLDDGGMRWCCSHDPQHCS